MMTKKGRCLTLLLALGLTLGGCASSSKEEKAMQNSPQKSFEQAQTALTQGNYKKATELLEGLDSRYPFGPYSHQVQLDMMYAYYKQGDYASAISTIDRFTKLNPQHTDLDYAYYMRGLNHMAMDSNFFQELLWVDRTDKDPSSSRQAFEDFANLIKRFPNSKYAADASQRMVFLKNRLANYELAVARYYVKRKAWVAAANRAQTVVDNYEGTKAQEKALELLVDCYDKLGIDELKAHALAVLKENYPDSALVQ
ncbi:outer membrane protein assembly factor BamD [Gallaecimonas kandeliae]|uniref:outer membrane protein assembly factor BamD n=1 Tax=Gallaecimonas kandeliae TaxID=3029055 RepID=UPI00264948AC|nr:outer membrane protein assembly factor BamD [Gallaecimonas kandeliae]WKE64947.1 outer membrane protein assembly factor BamD [Gallaecimonas kandeliae]